MAQELREDDQDRVAVRDAIAFDRRSRVIYLSKPRSTPEDTTALRFARILEEARRGRRVYPALRAPAHSSTNPSSPMYSSMKSIPSLLRALPERIAVHPSVTFISVMSPRCLDGPLCGDAIRPDVRDVA